MIQIFKTIPYTITLESGKQIAEPEILVGKIHADSPDRFFVGAVFDDKDNYNGEEILTKEEFFSRVPHACVALPEPDEDETEVMPDKIDFDFIEPVEKIRHSVMIFNARSFSKKKAFDALKEVSKIIAEIGAAIANA